MSKRKNHAPAFNVPRPVYSRSSKEREFFRNPYPSEAYMSTSANSVRSLWESSSGLVRLLALVFMFSLALPVVADAAFFGGGKADGTAAFVGNWVAARGTTPRGLPNELELFEDGTGIADRKTISWKVVNNRFVLSSSLEGYAYDYERSDGGFILITDNGDRERYMTREARKEEQRKAEEARKSEAEAPLKAAGFIALAPDRMNWSDAKAYCASKGGKLPRINNSGSFTWADRDKITSIDGFGKPGGRPWNEVVSYDIYWTGTESSDRAGFSWVVEDCGDGVCVYGTDQGSVNRVVCVP